MDILFLSLPLITKPLLYICVSEINIFIVTCCFFYSISVTVLALQCNHFPSLKFAVFRCNSYFTLIYLINSCLFTSFAVSIQVVPYDSSPFVFVVFNFISQQIFAFQKSTADISHLNPHPSHFILSHYS